MDGLALEHKDPKWMDMRKEWEYGYKGPKWTWNMDDENVQVWKVKGVPKS